MPNPIMTLLAKLLAMPGAAGAGASRLLSLAPELTGGAVTGLAGATAIPSIAGAIQAGNDPEGKLDYPMDNSWTGLGNALSAPTRIAGRALYKNDDPSDIFAAKSWDNPVDALSEVGKLPLQALGGLGAVPGRLTGFFDSPGDQYNIPEVAAQDRARQLHHDQSVAASSNPLQSAVANKIGAPSTSVLGEAPTQVRSPFAPPPTPSDPGRAALVETIRKAARTGGDYGSLAYHAMGGSPTGAYDPRSEAAVKANRFLEQALGMSGGVDPNFSLSDSSPMDRHFTHPTNPSGGIMP